MDVNLARSITIVSDNQANAVRCDSVVVARPGIKLPIHAVVRGARVLYLAAARIDRCKYTALCPSGTYW